MSSNQDQSNQHILYPQQHSYNAYPTSTSNTMGTWGQPNPQAVPYAIPYHGELNSATFPDKSAYSAGYSMQFGGGGDSDYFRIQNAGNYPHPPQGQITQTQWQQPPYQQGYTQVYGNYSNERDGISRPAFNPGAPPPNMNRPPPNIKRDNDGFQSAPDSLSLLDHSIQSAAYTASWVSSTSSIPPDLKDEPEFMPNHRELSSDVFSSQNFTQFENMSLHENRKGNEIGHWENKQTSMLPQQWPGLGQQSEHTRRRMDRDRRPRDEPRELTWEERLKKAQVQKERVERTTGVPGMPEKDRPESNGRGGRQRGGFGGRGLRDSGRENKRNEVQNQRDWKNESGGPSDFNHDLQNQQRNAQRNRGSNQMRSGGMQFNSGVMPPHNMNPMFAPACVGQQMMMNARGAPFVRGAPPHMAMQQDERFKNTWLDANAFPQPFMPFAPVSYGLDSRYGGGRGRGRGGRGRGSGGYGRRDRRDDERKDETESGVIGTTDVSVSPDERPADSNINDSTSNVVAANPVESPAA